MLEEEKEKERRQGIYIIVCTLPEIYTRLRAAMRSIHRSMIAVLRSQFSGLPVRPFAISGIINGLKLKLVIVFPGRRQFFGKASERASEVIYSVRWDERRGNGKKALDGGRAACRDRRCDTPARRRAVRKPRRDV